MSRRLLGLVTPNIGVLHQYDPRPLRVPSRYRRVAPPTPALPITIVTPSLNQGRFIERTVRSVLDQDYPALEYIVQDGGSSDETIAVLDRYRPRLSHVESAPDAGQADAINRGLARSGGELMAYLNADDVLLPGALAYVARRFADDPGLDVVYGHRVVIDELDREVGRWILPRHDDDVLGWMDVVPQETLFWRRRIWQEAGGRVDESLRFAIDWDLLLRFRDAGARFERLPRFLGALRVHPAQKLQAGAHVGLEEAERLRARMHGRRVSQMEILLHLAPYLARHLTLRTLYGIGLVRY